MGDENMDPCECIWTHELAMRRILSFLRQGQAYCTDTECIDELPRLGQSTESADNFVLMSVIMFFAIVMYALRPRQRRSMDEKPFSQDHGSRDLPPPPPPPATN